MSAKLKYKQPTITMFVTNFKSVANTDASVVVVSRRRPARTVAAAGKWQVGDAERSNPS